MSKSRVAKWIRWIVPSLALPLGAMVLLAGSGRHESQTSLKAQPAGISVSSGSEILPGIARAEVDTLDLQLD